MLEAVKHAEQSEQYYICLRAVDHAPLSFEAACKQVVVSTMCHCQACFAYLSLSL